MQNGQQTIRRNDSADVSVSAPTTSGRNALCLTRRSRAYDEIGDTSGGFEAMDARSPQSHVEEVSCQIVKMER
jgi:hypothetical protein